ncbi:MAG: hypothetical protein ILP13_10580, partial [Lachnospiraceae bacterium]|nr:hypothetical protein [Lachnospiraceae bacterium]
MKKKGPRIKNTFKSGFVRSLSIPLIATFLAIAAAIVLLVYFSFAKRLKARITANKWEEFTAIEDNITERLEEFDLIANDIYKSPTFLFADLPADKKQGYNMTSEVKRYLVGNQFLSYLIYYRNANPDKFFSSEGEINTKHFWDTYLNFEGETLEGFLGEIRDSYRHDVLPMRKSASRVVPNKTYLTLLEPIPLASPNPCAFAIGFVEKKTLNSYMDSIFSSCDGEIVIYDSGNNYLYDYKSGLDLDDETLSLVREKTWVDNQASFRHGGRTYVVQKSVSSYDKWQFFAVYDAKSLYREVFIAELFIYVIFAFVVLTALIFCLTVIARKFSPINQLAVSVMKDEDTEGKSVIDEHGLLQSRFLSLFEEKKKMYTALFFSNLMANQYDKALLEDALDEYNIEFHGNIFCPLAIMGGFDQDDRELVTKVTDCAWECLNSESITSYIHINMSPYCLVVCMNGQMDSFSYGNLVDIIRSLHEQMQKR